MRLYKLPILIQGPSVGNGDKYVAEIPALPGCRAWGDSAAEAVENVQSVATALLESYRQHGDQLPEEVEKLSSDTGQVTVSEVLIAI